MNQNKYYGLILEPGEKEEAKRLCLRYGIPLLYPILFEDGKDHHLWGFDKNGIGLMGASVFYRFAASGGGIIRGNQELEALLRLENDDFTIDENPSIDSKTLKSAKLAYYAKSDFKKVIDRYANKYGLKVILHFPHSSLDVPDSIYDDLLIGKEKFTFLNLKMSDVLLLELFKGWDYEKIIAPYSRLYVDVERYWDESLEAMAKFGMGPVYEKDLYGKPLHKKEEGFMEEAKKYYEQYQEKLSLACDSQNDVLLLDIHSFSREMADIPSVQPSLPDICFGHNLDSSFPKELLEEILVWNEANKAFTYSINKPYKGSMMPHHNKGKNKVYSLMLELNKAWYL